MKKNSPYYHGAAIRSAAVTALACLCIFNASPIEAEALDIDNQKWSVNFDSESDMDQFTVIDANADSGLPQNNTNNGIYGIWRYCTYQGMPSSDIKACVAYWLSQTFVDAADDWLITPAFNLKGGKMYMLRFFTRANFNWAEERLEVKMGDAPTTKSQTITLMNPTTINNIDGFHENLIEFVPDRDGTFYIGFHAISDNAKSFLYLDDISLERGAELTAPDKPLSISILSEESGKNEAKIVFTLPTRQIDGKTLSTDIGVIVKRNGIEIADMKGLKPGDEASFTDTDVPESGYYEYSVIPYNADGTGKALSSTAYVGLDTPAAPTNARISDSGSGISVSWDLPMGVHGGIVVPENITYEIWTVGYDYYTGYYKDHLMSKVKGVTEVFIEGNTNEGNLKQVYYAIFPMNEAGIGNNATTNAILVGKPLDMPFNETYTDGVLSNYWYISRSIGINWGRYSGFFANKQENATSGGDPGALEFKCRNNDHGTYTTGKINMSGAGTPKLSFAHKQANEQVVLSVDIVDPAGETASVYRSTGSTEEWTTEEISLDAFKDKEYILVSFNFDFDGVTWDDYTSYLDDVNIFDSSLSDISEISTNSPGTEIFDIYTPAGMLVKRAATSTDGLNPGIYIIGGKKILITK